jgi:hypothetical protein
MTPMSRCDTSCVRCRGRMTLTLMVLAMVPLPVLLALPVTRMPRAVVVAVSKNTTTISLPDQPVFTKAVAHSTLVVDSQLSESPHPSLTGSLSATVQLEPRPGRPDILMVLYPRPWVRCMTSHRP